MNKLKLIIIALLATIFMGAQAQTSSALSTEQYSNPNGFYLGIQANSSLMWGDLFSLGKETRLGYGGGIFAGYTLGGWFSPELSFDYNFAHAGAKEHQMNDYFNKAGIIKYVQYDPSDKKLGDIYSKTQYMQAGLRLQMGLISLIRGGRYTPFDIELAPAVYAQKFSPVLYAAADNSKLEGYGITESDWNYAVGGDLGLRYRFSPKVSAHLRGGLLWVRNEAFEGVNNDPLWRVNLLANASLGITFHLGKTKPIRETVFIPAEPFPTNNADKERAEAERLRREQQAREAEAKRLAEANRLAEERAAAEAKALAYRNEVENLEIPALFFRRGYSDINYKRYQANLDEMVATLNKYSDTDIAVEGWCDATGTKAVNDRLSQKRAEVLRDYLIKQGISAKRFVSVQGMGVDEQGGYAQIARRAMIKLRIGN